MGGLGRNSRRLPGNDRVAQNSRRLIHFAALLERTPATPPPERQCFRAALAPQDGSAFDQQPQDHRAIIVGQLDEASLSDQTAKLDQLAGALTPLHHPCPLVVTRDLRLQPMPRREGALQRQRGCHQQGKVPSPERRQHPACASPP